MICVHVCCWFNLFVFVLLKWPEAADLSGVYEKFTKPLHKAYKSSVGYLAYLYSNNVYALLVISLQIFRWAVVLLKFLLVPSLWDWYRYAGKSTCVTERKSTLITRRLKEPFGVWGKLIVWRLCVLFVLCLDSQEVWNYNHQNVLQKWEVNFIHEIFLKQCGTVYGEKSLWKKGDGFLHHWLR